MPGQVVLLEDGKIDSTHGHLTAKDLPHKFGQPPVDCFEHALLLHMCNAGGRTAKPDAFAISHLDKYQGLTVLYDQIEFAQRAAKLLTDQAAASLPQMLQRERLIMISESLFLASGRLFVWQCWLFVCLIPAISFASSGLNGELLSGLGEMESGEVCEM